MQPRLPDPKALAAKQEELDAMYHQAVVSLLDMYPAYAADPAAAGQSELFSEKTADLQKVEADLFLLRDKIEAGIVEVAAQIAKTEDRIQEYEGVDKKLSGRLARLDIQLDSADGRLQDAVYLYQERYLSNCILAAAVVGGAYHAYKGIFAKAVK